MTGHGLRGIRAGLGLSCADLGLTLGLAETNDDPLKRRRNAGITVRRWEKNGAPTWAIFAMRGLYAERGLPWRFGEIGAPLPPPRKAGPKTVSNRDGSQAAIWRELRKLGRSHPGWTMPELAEACDVPLDTVRSYVRALERAGKVKVIDESRQTQQGATHASYRVSEDLGPLPAIIRGEGGGRIAYDPNTRA